MGSIQSNENTAINNLTPFQQFVRSESFSGLLLIIAALVAFILANSPLSQFYFEYKNVSTGISIGEWSLKKPCYYWINDGLMAIFFLLVGLEIKRELLIGELSRPKDAALSVFAALGGMAVPALFYVFLNYNDTERLAGWGIPMATDIAFALGVLSLLGKSVPLSLKVFLTALAIVDDLGAVLVIALFYTEHIYIVYLSLSLIGIFLAWGYGRVGGYNLLIFLTIGLISWFFMLKSGVHATIAGVLLAFAIPMRRGSFEDSIQHDAERLDNQQTFEKTEINLEHMEDAISAHQSPLHRLEHALVPWVSFFIMPLFALANAGVKVGGNTELISTVSAGCFLGLILGKSIGIFSFCWITSKLGLSKLPESIKWIQIFWIGIMAGIGFTMSFFIAGLAFDDPALLDQSKIGILSASLLAAIIGFIGLKTSLRNNDKQIVQEKP